MENAIKIFTHPEFGNVRIVDKNGAEWFVGKDVATILQYADTDKAIRTHVDEEDKQILKAADLAGLNDNANFFPADVPNRGLIIINESGLYSLILSSKLPKAKEFKRWVTSEVLPAIRKTGVYAPKDFAKQAISNPAWAIEILTALQQEREEKEHLQELVSIQSVQIEEMRPKASYYDLILQSKEAIPVSVIAKDYGMSGKAMNQLLHKLEIQYRCAGTWLVYQNYAAKGYTVTKTIPINDEFSKTHTNWTQKGRLFLYEKLKQHGHLPLIEQTEDLADES